jgi:hypothetical protein
VADGTLMGWVYKLKSIENEIPAATFFRDLTMFARQKNCNFTVNKTAAALNYWLNYERNDLPLEITRMSFASYNTPIGSDGTLPVRLFGKKLNLNRLKEKKIPWLICYGTQDKLVEKETALAALDHVDAELTPFPKGHVAIATSWSNPTSAYALHKRFESGKYRGPVRFHMDLNQDLEERHAVTASPKKPASPPKKTAAPVKPVPIKPVVAKPVAAKPATVKPPPPETPKAAPKKPKAKKGAKASPSKPEKAAKSTAPKRAPKTTKKPQTTR